MDDTPGLAGEVAEGGLAGAVLVWARAGKDTPVATRAAAIDFLEITTSWETQRSVSVIKTTASLANRFKVLHREIQRRNEVRLGTEVRRQGGSLLGTVLSGTYCRNSHGAKDQAINAAEVIMAALTRDDIVGILKPAEDTVVVQILATGATKEEFAEAYAWMQSDEALMNAGRSLPSGRVGQIVTILQAVEDDAPGVAPPE